jgi:hypothetical protein
MTFLEAAIVVLQRESRPLHFREITKRAISMDLLSHVGKAPEQTMRARLAAAVHRAKNPEVIRTGQGIYSAASNGGAHDAPSVASERPPRSKRRRSRKAKSNGGGSADLLFVLEMMIAERTRPVPIAELAAMARSRGYLSRTIRREEGIITSLLEAENALAAASGLRPRFIIENKKADLYERIVDKDVLDCEGRIAAEREILRQSARDRVGERLKQLSIGSLAVIVRACVDEPPLADVKLVNVSSSREALLSSRSQHSVRGGVAIVVMRDPSKQSLVTQRAVELRRSLRHLRAYAGILVVTTRVEEKTRKAAGIPGDPVIEIWDRDELIRRMERRGIGFRDIGLCTDPFDVAFFEGLES